MARKVMEFQEILIVTAEVKFLNFKLFIYLFIRQEDAGMANILQYS